MVTLFSEHKTSNDTLERSSMTKVNNYTKPNVLPKKTTPKHNFSYRNSMHLLSFNNSVVNLSHNHLLYTDRLN